MMLFVVLLQRWKGLTMFPSAEMSGREELQKRGPLPNPTAIGTERAAALNHWIQQGTDTSVDCHLFLIQAHRSSVDGLKWYSGFYWSRLLVDNVEFQCSISCIRWPQLVESIVSEDVSWWNRLIIDGLRLKLLILFDDLLMASQSEVWMEKLWKNITHTTYALLLAAATLSPTKPAVDETMTISNFIADV